MYAMSTVESIERAGVEPLSRQVRRNIKAEAARRDWSQSDLAARMGMRRGAVADRFRGRTPWTLDETQLAATLFGLPITDLWAPRGSNPEPTDYGSEGGAVVLEFPSGRVA